MLAKRYKEDGLIDICTCKQLQPQFILTARIHCSSPPPPPTLFCPGPVLHGITPASTYHKDIQEEPALC